MLPAGQPKGQQATSIFDYRDGTDAEFRPKPRTLFGPQAACQGSPALSRLPLTASRCTDAFDLGGAFRRGSRAARPALGIGLNVANRLSLRVNRLGLRIADRLGQHLMQLGLGRCGGLCHFATISLST
jgi:hypothetical protein